MHIRGPFLSVSLVIIFLFSTPLNTFAESAPIVRAKLGIALKSGKRISRATSHDRIRAGDRFRIFVHPEKGCTVYIVYTDEKSVSLLNASDHTIESCTLILPSTDAYYNVDGASRMERIAIICSPEKLPEIESIETEKISYTHWTGIIDRLIERSRIVETQKYEKPFSIAGNVRGMCGSDSNDAFVKNLQMYSGKGLLVKTYEFKVKK